MPTIEIMNFPTGHERGYDHLVKLAELLKWACVHARIHGLEDTAAVTVVENGRRLDPEDRAVVLRVFGLFKRPERTDEDRARLAKALAKCAHGYYGGQEKVEVLVGPFVDPDDGAYAEIERTAPVALAES